jgi:predicted Zn-dependent peptidase
MRLQKRFIGLLMSVAAAPPAVAEIPKHPDQIAFPPLQFTPPAAADFRHTISTSAGEVPVYLAPSAEFPLISVTFTFKGGGDLDPSATVGLTSAMASMMRRGGTTTVGAADMDEEFDFLAAIAGSRAGGTRTTASLNTLTANFEQSFGRFMDMVRNPGFDADRLTVYEEEQMEAMKQRNDHPASILAREWRYLLWGENSFMSALPTEASIASVTGDDLRSMHKRIVHPGNLIISVTGDFDEQPMLDRLELALGGWPGGEAVGDPPAPDHQLVPGLYSYEKDIPQGRVDIGQRSIRRDDPDYFPLLLMNRILGGGGFTSRIVSRVRSDEGLAYSARSRLTPNVYFPGHFQAGFQSKNRTVALAIKLILEEIDGIRTSPVSAEELETAQNALIETFPQRFESKAGMLRTFVNDEMTDRDPDYWNRYRDNVRAVTAQDIMRAAAKHLHPDQMAILVVGKWQEIRGGDLEGRATMDEFFGGNVTVLEPRDPMTLKVHR